MKNWVKAFALVLSLAAGSAQADEFYFIGDSDDGNTRLLGKRGTLKVQKSGNTLWVVRGVFALYDTNTSKKSMLNIEIDVASCKDGGGEMRYGANAKDVREMFWASKGPRMYDMAGRSMCESLDAWAEHNKKENEVKRPVVNSRI